MDEWWKAAARRHSTANEFACHCQQLRVAHVVWWILIGLPAVMSVNVISFPLHQRCSPIEQSHKHGGHIPGTIDDLRFGDLNRMDWLDNFAVRLVSAHVIVLSVEGP